MFEDLVEDLQGTTAIDHEVFGDDLEPIDDGLAGEDVLVMRHAQADADSVIGESVEATWPA